MKNAIKVLGLVTALFIIICLLGVFVSCDSDNISEIESESNTSPETSDKETTDSNIPQITPCPWDDISLPIPAEIKREIQIARLKGAYYGDNYEKKGYIPEQVWVVCYGIFNDTYCVMTWEPDVIYLNIETEVAVGGYTFLFSSENTMLVYSEGQFTSLKVAYNYGIINDDELAELYNYCNEVHQDGVMPSVHQNGTPSPELIKEIQSAYFEKTYEEEYADYYNSPNQVRLKYYGSFDNAYCFILDCPIYNYSSVMTEVEVGGYTFVFGSSNTMQVYCDGEFYGLKQAYENGILNKVELAKLYSYYNEVKWGK